MSRPYLTQREHASLYAAQRRGCCVETCDGPEGLIAEHSTPNALRPGKPDQLMCVACHRVKTRSDLKATAKAKRLNCETMSRYEWRKKFGARLRGHGFERRE